MAGALADSATKPGRVHIKHVEGLRAIAALVVFVNHAYAQTWNPGQTPPPDGLLSLVSYSLIAGHLSVTVFIVVSGFCLALPIVSTGELRGGAGAFFKRRARRILPPYYGAVALCLVLIGTILGQPTGTIWDVPIQVSRNSIVSHLLLLQDFYGTGSVNYVFWSIAVEWQIYFLFPLLVWGWRRFGPAWTVTTALVVGFALRFGLAATRVARANPQYLGMFALGMLAAFVATAPGDNYARVRRSSIWVWGSVIGLATVGALTVVWGIALAHERFHLLDLPTGVMAASLLVLATRSPEGVLARAFSLRPLVFVGTFSYSVYLIHAPLLQILWQFVLQPLHIDGRPAFWFFMTLGLAFVLGSSRLFFRVFEEPFMRAPERRMPAAVPAAR